jgi:hypothetical protein
MPPSEAEGILAAIAGAIEQCFGASAQDLNRVLALITTPTDGCRQRGSVAMVAVSALSPTIMLVGLGLCLAYIFWRW